MTTEIQAEANRRNALQSTGPKTGEGIEAARFNALRHGLRALQTVVPGEAPEEWEAHRIGVVEDLKPEGAVELALAKIPRETSAGILDLHSTRHTFVSEIVAGGANVKTAQELARHSTPKLTFDVYAHARLHDVVGTVERLPDPFQPPARPESARATGTDGEPIKKRFAEHLPNGGDGTSRVDSVAVGSAAMSSRIPAAHKSSDRPDLPPVVGLVRDESEARPVGFEPTTFGFEVRDSIR